jgi:hypothetical protein
MGDAGEVGVGTTIGAGQEPDIINLTIETGKCEKCSGMEGDKTQPNITGNHTHLYL